MADENPNYRMNIDLNSPPLDDPISEVVEPRFPSSPANGDAEKTNLVQQKGSLFDCSICIDIAKEPVVTCCGHLFCWPCLYRWLNHHLSSQCPICKGEVTVTNVTPIYGHDNSSNNNNNNKLDNGGRKNIPLRPKARRIESARRDFPLGQQGSSNEGLTSVDLAENLNDDYLLSFDFNEPSFYSYSYSFSSDSWGLLFDDTDDIDSTVPVSNTDPSRGRRRRSHGSEISGTDSNSDESHAFSRRRLN